MGPRLTSWMAVVLLLACALPGAVAKVVTGQVALNNATQWAYLTKFSYSLGSGNFTLDVTPSVRCVSLHRSHQAGQHIHK